jgi:hypothetical protein
MAPEAPAAQGAPAARAGYCQWGVGKVNPQLVKKFTKSGSGDQPGDQDTREVAGAGPGLC